MTAPPIHPSDFVKKLGPGFDYSSLDRLARSPIFGNLPEDIQNQVRSTLDMGVNIQRAANPAPIDRIGDGAFPAPPLPATRAQGFESETMSVLGMLPGIGILAQANQAYALSKEKGIPFTDAYSLVWQHVGRTSEEMMHQLTAGVYPSPVVPEAERIAFNTITKPATAALAMGLQGLGVSKALGFVSKVPVANNLIEQLPQRLRDVGMGATTFGVLDAMRADGIPNDPGVLDPSGNLAKKLAGMGIPEHLALFMSGTAVGGVIGGTLLGVQRGIEWGRAQNFARSVTDEQLGAMRQALTQLGVKDVPGTSKVQVINAYVKAMSKVATTEELAGLVSQQLSREEWIAQTVFGTPDLLAGSEDARYMTGLLRGQPGAVSVATNVIEPAWVTKAADKLGLQVDMVALQREAVVAPDGTKLAPTYDVLISRPDYKYAEFAQSDRSTRRATRLIDQLAKSNARDVFAQQSNDLFILADGTTVRGGFSTEELAKKLKPQVPIVDGVARPDLGVKKVASMVNMSITEDNKLVIDLPTKLTQEQFQALAPAVNVNRFEQVLIKSGDKSVVIDAPLGQQVQDATAKLVAPQSRLSKLTKEMVNQYKQSGVFKGQAAVLLDGSPVEVQGKAGTGYLVKDPLTGKVLSVHRDKLSILPTTMEGDMSPGTGLFYQYLDPVEQQAMAKYRLAALEGLDQRITTVKDLERFGNSKGFFVTRVGDQIELVRATDNQSMRFNTMAASIKFIRDHTAPLPDLTPDIVKKVLGGNANFGISIGAMSGPPKYGEMIPIPREMVVQALTENAGGRGPGAFGQFFTPSRGLFLDMDKRFGTNFYPLFSNLQSRMVARQNFQVLWLEGKGGGLPEGIKPLKEITKLAGSSANTENITALLEGKAVVGATIGERQAAEELRKWYDGLFKHFGIEADYVQNYAPRMRDLAQQYGNNPRELYNTVLKNDPLKPNAALNFFADNYRSGGLDIYDLDAFRAATRYLTQGAGNRFMKEPIQQATEMVYNFAKVNKRLAYPMGYFLQAVRGTEFSEQRLALTESMQGLLDALPGTVKAGEVSATADKLTAYWMGAVYSGTMGFRPGLALRNVATSLMMSYPLFGGSKGRYLEAIGTALTQAGKEAAIADGAISLRTLPVYESAELGDLASKLPHGFDRLAEAGFYMYESADQFTRAQTYWAARLSAEEAIGKFAKKSVGATENQLVKLRADLLRDSGIHMQDKQVVEEFLRRMLVSPEGAARYAGKQASDVVNFLYGRGMQTRWMRGLQGRLLGQFGTWSMWYVDYLRRTTQALATNSGNIEAAKFLAKHALVNASIAYAGKKALDVDLGSWMTYPAVFYSGGPGFQVAQGLSTLARGLSGVSSGDDSEYGPVRVSTGVATIQQTLPSMIPFWFAARDAYRFGTTDDPVERLAILTGAKPDPQHVADRKFQQLLGIHQEPFSSTSWVLEGMANSAAAGQPLSVDPYQLLQQGIVLPDGSPGPALTQKPPVLGTSPAPAAPPMVAPPNDQTPGLTGAPKGSTNRKATVQGEAASPAESRPIPNY